MLFYSALCFNSTWKMGAVQISSITIMIITTALTINTTLHSGLGCYRPVLTASREVVEELVEVSMTPPPPPSSSELPTKGRLLRRSSPLLTFSSEESATRNDDGGDETTTTITVLLPLPLHHYDYYMYRYYNN